MEEWGTIITTTTTILPFPTNQRWVLSSSLRGFFGGFSSSFLELWGLGCGLHIGSSLRLFFSSRGSVGVGDAGHQGFDRLLPYLKPGQLVRFLFEGGEGVQAVEFAREYRFTSFSTGRGLRGPTL